jgi:hypothetical protein
MYLSPRAIIEGECSEPEALVQTIQPNIEASMTAPPGPLSNFDLWGLDEVQFWKLHKGRNKELRSLRHVKLRGSKADHRGIDTQVGDPFEWCPFPHRIPRMRASWGPGLICSKAWGKVNQFKETWAAGYSS